MYWFAPPNVNSGRKYFLGDLIQLGSLLIFSQCAVCYSWLLCLHWKRYCISKEKRILYRSTLMSLVWAWKMAEMGTHRLDRGEDRRQWAGLGLPRIKSQAWSPPALPQTHQSPSPVSTPGCPGDFTCLGWVVRPFRGRLQSTKRPLGGALDLDRH